MLVLEGSHVAVDVFEDGEGMDQNATSASSTGGPDSS